MSEFAVSSIMEAPVEPKVTIAPLEPHVHKFCIGEASITNDSSLFRGSTTYCSFTRRCSCGKIDYFRQQVVSIFDAEMWINSHLDSRCDDFKWTRSD